MDIEVVEGDITTVAVDAVVTAANRALVGGGGVDAAVHRAAGPQPYRALRPLAPCPPGGAVVTPAFALDPPVRWAVHAVGPRYGIVRGPGSPAACSSPSPPRSPRPDGRPSRRLPDTAAYCNDSAGPHVPRRAPLCLLHH